VIPCSSSSQRSLDETHLDEVLELIDWVSDVSATESAGALLSPAVPRAKQVVKLPQSIVRTLRF
jgi:hypothetical protein